LKLTNSSATREAAQRDWHGPNGSPSFVCRMAQFDLTKPSSSNFLNHQIAKEGTPMSADHWPNTPVGDSSNADLLAFLIDERKAARLLGISPRTLWTLRKSGKIPAIQIGRLVRYSLEDLNRFVQQNRTQMNDSARAEEKN